MSLQQPAFNLAALLPPFHEITLPTNGLYDPEIPKTLNIRGMTVKELKHLTANGRLDRKVFDGILSGCIKETIDLSKLLIEDYNYLVFMIRLHSTGSEVTAAKNCNGCGKHFNFSYNISECAHVEYAEEPIDKSITVPLPRFKENGFNVQVEVRRLTRNEVIAVERNIRAATELAAKLNTPSSVFPLVELLKSYIVSVSGFNPPIPKEMLLDVLSKSEAEAITSAFGDATFGVKGNAEVPCPICNAVNTYEIPFTDTFFL